MSDAANAAAPDPREDADHTAPTVRPVDLRDYVDFSEDAARRVRVFTTPELALDLWCIEPQQATPVLHHEDQRITYTVIGGRSWFVTDEGEVGLDPMGSLLVPPGVVQGIDNRAPDPLIVVAVSSPPTLVTQSRPVEERGEAIRREPDRPNVLRRVADRLFGGRR
jgi:quercetin dioxygenase-like cupin family protein